MPYVPVSKALAVNRPCKFMGEVSIPLYTPPYTVAELGIAANDPWIFAPSLDFAHISDAGGALLGTQPILTSFTDISINAFSYFTTKFQHNVNGTYGSRAGRAGNSVAQINRGGIIGSSGQINSATFISKANLNMLYNSYGQVTFKANDASSWINFGNTGFCLDLLGTLCYVEPISFSGAFVDVDFFGHNFFFIKTARRFQTARITGLTNFSLLATLPGFPLNYSAVDLSWGDPPASFIYVLEWSSNAFNDQNARMVRPVFTDPAINTAFDTTSGNTCIAVPKGFIFASNTDIFTTQHGTYILVARDCTKYWLLKFIAQSDGANIAINGGAVGSVRIFIDAFGVTYLAREAPTNPRGVIYNSQGFSFPFRFDVAKIPYANLPCWQPCFGVTTKKSSGL